MISIRPRRILGLAAVAAAAACNTDSSVGPSVPATLEGVLAEMSLPVAAQPGGFSFNLYENPAQGPLSTACGYSPATQRFDCPTFTSPAVTVTQWFMLADAAGAPQSSWDARTTDVLRINQVVHAYVASSRDSLTIDTRQDLTVSGLLSGRHTLNGTQVAHRDEVSNVVGPERSVTDISQQITNLVLNSSADRATAWPLSGTLTSDITETSDTPPTHIRTVITFNGTSKVQVTLTVDGFTSPACTLDLTNPIPGCFFFT